MRLPSATALRAGQRGQVDQHVRARAASHGVRQRVGEHQPALGVGVGGLAGGAAVVPDDVAGAERRAADHVLRQRRERGDPDRQVAARPRRGWRPRRRRRRPCPCASASSPSRGLIEMPPVSKVMPLPTSTTCGRAPAAGCQRSSTRRGPLAEPPPTARIPPKPSAASRLGLADRRRQPGQPGGGRRRPARRTRRGLFTDGGGVGEVTGEAVDPATARAAASRPRTPGSPGRRAPASVDAAGRPRAPASVGGRRRRAETGTTPASSPSASPRTAVRRRSPPAGGT